MREVGSRMAGMTRLATAVGVRPGEGRLAGLLATLFAGLEMGRGLGEVGANALLLARLGADVLPWLYIVLGSTLLVLALAYGAALGRIRGERLLPGLLVAIAVALAIEAVIVLASPSPVITAVAWLTVAAATTAGMTVSWTVATSSVDARQAKRLFPVCTAAAIGGYLAGSLAAGPLARLAPTEVLLVCQAGLFGAGALLVPRVAAATRAGGWSSGRAGPSRGGRSVLRALRAGLEEVVAIPLLRLVAVAYVLFAVLAFSVSFPFFRIAAATYPDEAELAGILGLIAALVAVASLVVALAVANRFYARFGVAAAALLLPIVYVAGFGLWVVQFTFTTAALVSVTQQVAQRGLSNAAWSAFYAVVPSTRRPQAIAFIDGVPGQVGIILSGVLLLTAGRVLAPDQVAWLGLAAAVACTAVVLAIRRGYARALVATLRAGAGERVLDGGPTLGDLSSAPDVRATLVAALRDPDAGVRAMAAGLLARAPGDDARRGLSLALDDPHPAVREAAIVAILRGGDPDPRDADAARAEGALVDLLEGDALDRVLGLRALDRIGRAADPALLDAALADPDAPLRAMAMTCLPTGDAAATACLIRGLRDPSGLVRRAAATRLAAFDRVPDEVVVALDAPEPEVREAALVALEGHGPSMRDVVLPWAEAQVTRALVLDRAATALHVAGGSDHDPYRALLADALQARVRQHRGLVLAGMVVLGVPEASGVLRRAITSDDPERRAHAAEALETLADRRLGAALARLIDRAPVPAAPVREETLRRLADDEDRWIRRLARTVLGMPWRADDIDTDDGVTTATIDRMLHLRRVPLFAGLVPEDLQRIALAARERTWATGAEICIEGAHEDELFIIVEGRVRVIRREPDGTERLLRTYGPGDHFGELAVLRDRPRAATVVADGGPVHTLGIDGEALAAILRERPEAAMAMLATLADRISLQ